MSLVLSGAMAVSAIIVAVLGIGDPKRRRSAGLRGEGWSRRQRILLTVVACLPGLLLGIQGDAAAFLIWLGACALMGWCVAIWSSVNRADSPARSVRRASGRKRDASS